MVATNDYFLLDPVLFVYLILLTFASLPLPLIVSGTESDSNSGSLLDISSDEVGVEVEDIELTSDSDGELGIND